MFRQSLDPGSANAFFFFNAGGSGIGTQARTSTGANTQSNALPPYLYYQTYSVRLNRSGNTFTVYGKSPYDPPNYWYALASWQIPMTDPVCVGMAVSSHDNSILQTSQFPSLRLVPLQGTLAATRQNNNAIQITLAGMISHTYGIDASTNLINWTRLTNQFNTSGFITFTETNATRFRQRFYRSVVVR